MRAYTVATTALALDVDAKWIDNLLSHHKLPGVARSQRGVRRRIPPRSVFMIALARSLGVELSIPLHRALEIAIELESRQAVEYRISDLLTFRIDRDRFHSELSRRLDDAAEIAAVPQRGRPPRLSTGSRP